MYKEKKIDRKEKVSSLQNRKKLKWAIRGAIIIIIILLILLGLQKCGGNGDGSGVIIGAGVHEGEIDMGYERNKTEENSNGKSEMTVRINGTPVFADGQSEGNLNIENPAVNGLHMNVVITLNSTSEVIYNSGTIPPNHYVDNDKLTTILKNGTYEATAHVTLFDPEYPDTNYNSANFTLIITIEN